MALENLPYDPFKRDDDRSLINLVPPSFQNAMLEAHKSRPELFGLDEHNLTKTLRATKELANPSDNRLRMKFWMEFEAAQAAGRKPNLSYVYSGICSDQYFYGKYLSEPTKVAWLLCPPANYVIVTEEALQVGLETLRGYLTENAMKDNGFFDRTMAELQFKIVAFLDNRVKGAVVQKTMNLHAGIPKGKIEEITEVRSMDELEKRLKALELRKQKFQAQNEGKTLPKAVITVEQDDPHGDSH